MAVSEDASTPAPVRASNTSSPAVTASFTPPAGSLVVALVSILYFDSIGSATAAVSDSLGNTYPQAADSGAGGFTRSQAFWYYYSGSPGAITVSATPSALPASIHLTVRVADGAAPVAAQNGATVSSAAASGGTLVTTVAGSLPYAVASTGEEHAATALGSTVTLSTFEDGPSEDTGVSGKGSVTVTPGSLSLGWSGLSGGGPVWCAVEVVPAPSLTPVSDTDSSSAAAESAVLSSADVSDADIAQLHDGGEQAVQTGPVEPDPDTASATDGGETIAGHSSADSGSFAETASAQTFVRVAISDSYPFGDGSSGPALHFPVTDADPPARGYGISGGVLRDGGEHLAVTLSSPDTASFTESSLVTVPKSDTDASNAAAEAASVPEKIITDSDSGSASRNG